MACEVARLIGREDAAGNVDPGGNHGACVQHAVREEALRKRLIGHNLCLVFGKGRGQRYVGHLARHDFLLHEFECGRVHLCHVQSDQKPADGQSPQAPDERQEHGGRQSSIMDQH